ncbi:MAG: hypothetical protein KJP16_12070 [Gammaproteobacteria bacterium]|nr:hypothetical protein [Gammaproteobacteria bacterium]NNL51542.1 hypothetical protein [Woeseiaceae bacterium]
MPGPEINQGTSGADNATPTPAQGLVYVAPGHVLAGDSGDRISLRQIWHILLRGKYIVIASAAVFAVASVAYALLATEIYRAEVVLIPATEQSTPMIGGQLGGLAALAGVDIADSNEVEAMAVLRSREFAREFIRSRDLLPVFFAEKWDAENGRWSSSGPDEVPEIRDGVKLFHKQILKVGEDRSAGLVTVAIEWTDPDVAAEWAGALVQRLNDRLRERALQEARTNVDYLQQEMAQTTLFPLQESIGRLLEIELQKLMLAKGNAEFAFKIVDPAVPPKQRLRPKRAMTAIIGTLLGGLLGVFTVLVIHSVRDDDESAAA